LESNIQKCEDNNDHAACDQVLNFDELVMFSSIIKEDLLSYFPSAIQEVTPELLTKASGNILARKCIDL